MLDLSRAIISSCCLLKPCCSVDSYFRRCGSKWRRSYLLLKEKICAKNCFESYVYNTKNTLGGRNSEAMKEIEDSIEDSLDLIDDSADAEKEDYIDRQKEVGQIDNPIMRQFYASGTDRNEVDFDFEDYELWARCRKKEMMDEQGDGII